jgi:hypothetical protein
MSDEKPANPTEKPSPDLKIVNAVKETEKKSKESAQVSPELINQINSLKMFKVIDELLKVGLFQGVQNENIGRARGFISALHGNMKSEILKTPQGVELLFNEDKGAQ